MMKVDALVVGARCAGSAAAIALARSGRRVLCVDRSAFPSDTLSTHLLFPSGVAELARLGALERVLALDPPRCDRVELSSAGRVVRERYRPVDGIDYGLCVPRPQLDLALVRTAREAGAEVLERADLRRVCRTGTRVTGAVIRHEGSEVEVRAPLVVGADGRRSSVARHVGEETPYRTSRNGRGLAFWYMDDPRVGTRWRSVATQWRVGDTHGMVFPCPDERMLVLLMGPAERIPVIRRDPEGALRAALVENRRLAARVDGATNPSRLRSTDDTVSFFRRSSGPGWALAGDAGHFKDPVAAQGIRDALRFGRLLGETAAPVLDDAVALDRALEAWERARDRDVLSTYHWGNRETRVGPVSPLVTEAFGDFGRTEDPDLTDLFNRTRRPEAAIGLRRSGRLLARALARPGAPRTAILREAVDELRMDAGIQWERRAGRWRSARPLRTERPGAWPPPRVTTRPVTTRPQDRSAA